MKRPIELKELPAQHTISIREQVNRSGLSEALAELLPRAASFLEQRGVQPAGPPFIRYHSSHDVERVEVDVEVGYPVSQAIEAGEDIFVSGQLPEGPALITRYKGDYDGSFRAYDELEAWIKENEGYEARSAPWENYLVAPEAADENQLELEIVYPLQRVDEERFNV